MKKKMFSTLITIELLKEFKKLAIDLERPANDILEEAMRDFLEKYKRNPRSHNQGKRRPELKSHFS